MKIIDDIILTGPVAVGKTSVLRDRRFNASNTPIHRHLQCTPPGLDDVPYICMQLARGRREPEEEAIVNI